MGFIEKEFDGSRAGAAGQMYAQKHYKATLLWVFLHRWGSVLGLVALVGFVLWMGR